MDDEAAVAGRERGEVDLRRKATGVAEHAHSCRRHASRLLPGPSAPSAPMIRSSKPSPLTSPAEDTEWPDIIVRAFAMDDEAAVAGRDRGEVDLRRKTAGLAEHHIAVARLVACVAGAIGDREPR